MLNPELEQLADLYAAIDSATTTMAFSSRDWSARRDDAWLYGILAGWDDDATGGDVDQTGGAMGELAARFGWSDAEVERLRRLRAAVKAFDVNKVADLTAREG